LSRRIATARARVLPEIERGGPIRAWIIDDTGFPKKGTHSVGVARQYCGQLGKQDNCQIAVTLSVASDHASLPIAYRLYLPEPWAEDPERRAEARVPENVRFQTKPQIALAQIRAAQEAGVPPATVLTARRLRHRHRFPRWHHRAWSALHRRGPILDDPVAAGGCAACSQPGSASSPPRPHPIKCYPPVGTGQSLGPSV
jgi:hypothetical protein